MKDERRSVLVTGAEGFVGRHLSDALSHRADVAVDGVDVGSPPETMARALGRADVIFHLAGVNRPTTVEEYSENLILAENLCVELESRRRAPLVVFASSAQATLDNPYGRSKLAAENALRDWAGKTGATVAIFRLTNVFGKWSRPNYNSAVATFCHNAARGLPLPINDPAAPLKLIYIDDVVTHLVRCLDNPPSGVEYREATPVFRTSVGEIADLVLSFSRTRETLIVPDLGDLLTAHLYATYLSFLPEDRLLYDLPASTDARGALAEVLKQSGFGQIFLSRTAPGVTRGDHYHHTKTEKFVVVEGQAIIRFRDVRGGPVTEYRVDGRDFHVLDVPPGLTHSIENVGEEDLVTLFYASEMFDPTHPDTYHRSVLEMENGGGTS